MDRDSTWDISDPIYETGGVPLDFTSIETAIGGSGQDTFIITGAVDMSLNGGPGDDTFIFNDGASLTGAVQGSGGTDTLDFSRWNVKPNADLISGVTDNVLGGNGSIERLIFERPSPPAPPSPSAPPAPQREAAQCPHGRIVPVLGCVYYELAQDAPTIFTGTWYGIFVEIAGGAAPADSIAMFIVALPDSSPPPKMIFVGAMITIWMTAPDGSAVADPNAPIKLTFTIPEGLEVPAGGELMIAYYDPRLGWQLIAATRMGNQLIASVTSPGTYVLVIVLR